jgi:hypothetical protein
LFTLSYEGPRAMSARSQLFRPACHPKPYFSTAKGRNELNSQGRQNAEFPVEFYSRFGIAGLGWAAVNEKE